MNTEQKIETLDEINEKANKGYDKLRDKLTSAGDRIDEMTAQTRERVEDAWQNAGDLVREHPMASVGLALLVGAGIGALLTAWANRD